MNSFKLVCGSRGSHSDVYEEFCLLGYIDTSSVKPTSFGETCRLHLHCWRMSSEMYVCFQQTSSRYSPEDITLENCFFVVPFVEVSTLTQSKHLREVLQLFFISTNASFKVACQGLFHVLRPVWCITNRLFLNTMPLTQSVLYHWS
jgi:hypothetical protein